MSTLAITILAVGATTALLIWGSLRVFRDAERMQRNPKLLRRRLLLMGLFYVGSATYGLIEVATGEVPPIGLIGLPFAALFAWAFLKGASNVKVDPP